jgi:hypothetical protein
MTIEHFPTMARLPDGELGARVDETGSNRLCASVHHQPLKVLLELSWSLIDRAVEPGFGVVAS